MNDWNVTMCMWQIWETVLHLQYCDVGASILDYKLVTFAHASFTCKIISSFIIFRNQQVLTSSSVDCNYYNVVATVSAAKNIDCKSANDARLVFNGTADGA